MRKRKKKYQKKKFWRINEHIFASELRVIDSNGKQVGILPRDEAIKLSQKAGLDLVEIAPRAKPPVARIISFGKFKYAEEKKARKQGKKSKGGELKEVRFSPFIDKADYNTRLDRVKEFLEDGNKVRAVVKFKGRQMGSKQFGYNILNKMIKDIDQEVNIDMKPKFMGRHLVMVISPIKSHAKTKSPKISH